MSQVSTIIDLSRIKESIEREIKQDPIASERNYQANLKKVQQTKLAQASSKKLQSDQSMFVLQSMVRSSQRQQLRDKIIE